MDERQAAEGVVLVEEAREGIPQLAGQSSQVPGERHKAIVRPWSDRPEATTLRRKRDDEEVAVSVRAYVLIQTEVGKAASVATKVAEIPGVLLADDVTGPYDVIVQAEADSVDELGKMVVSRVQLIEGITRTLTCPVVHL